TGPSCPKRGKPSWRSASPGSCAYGTNWIGASAAAAFPSPTARCGTPLTGSPPKDQAPGCWIPTQAQDHSPGAHPPTGLGKWATRPMNPSQPDLQDNFKDVSRRVTAPKPPAFKLMPVIVPLGSFVLIGGDDESQPQEAPQDLINQLEDFRRRL